MFRSAFTILLIIAILSQGLNACPPLQKACNGRCSYTLMDSHNCGRCGVVCGENASCVMGGCIAHPACEPVENRCNGGCHDLLQDPLHCGWCNLRCGGDMHCIGGLCTCPPRMQDCMGVCVDIGANCLPVIPTM